MRLNIKLCINLGMILLILAGCGSPSGPAEPTAAQEPTAVPTSLPAAQPTGSPTLAFTTMTPPGAPLREIAQHRNFSIGAAVAYEPLMNEPTYGEVLAREFNMLTAENVMKFDALHPAQDRYDFSTADALVAFAQENEMQVRGHTLVWHKQLPDWLTTGEWTREELTEILRDHITTVVSHYRGQMTAWDVVNEAISDNNTMRLTLWHTGIGPEYIDMAFQWAHEADPDARLFYNDYSAEGLGPRSNAVYELVKGMLDRGVPIHGVGLQFHTDLSSSPDLEFVALNIQRLADLGLEVHITEMDVRVLVPADDTALIQQANLYHGVTQLCLEQDACRALVLWGFTDKYSWIPGIHTGYGDALILDESYLPKPAYLAVQSALAGE